MRLSERKLAIIAGGAFAVAATGLIQATGIYDLSGRPSAPAMALPPALPAPALAAAPAVGPAVDAPAPGDAPAPVRSAQKLAAAAAIDEPEGPRILAARSRAPAATTGATGDIALPQPPADARRVATLPPSAAPGLPARARSDAGFRAPLSDAELGLSPFGTPCGVSLAATQRPGAMISLTLEAPCRPDTRVEVTHGALTVAQRTNAYGGLQMQIPALAEQSLVSARFGDGLGASVVLHVDGLDRVERVVLQWDGPADLDLHALEFGAETGTPGDVWAGAGRSPAHAARVGGGFLVALGDPEVAMPKQAEVYTLPLTERTTGGTVRMHVAAKGGADACDDAVAARTLRLSAGAAPAALDLRLDLPACGAQQTLLLKNAVQDLKIARN